MNYQCIGLKSMGRFSSKIARAKYVVTYTHTHLPVGARPVPLNNCQRSIITIIMWSVCRSFVTDGAFDRSWFSFTGVDFRQHFYQKDWNMQSTVHPDYNKIYNTKTDELLKCLKHINHNKNIFKNVNVFRHRIKKKKKYRFYHKNNILNPGNLTK